MFAVQEHREFDVSLCFFLAVFFPHIQGVGSELELPSQQATNNARAASG